jgi:transposase-like protein
VISIAAKIGCTPQTLNDWVKKADVDSGRRAGITNEMADRVKALERENRGGASRHDKRPERIACELAGRQIHPVNVARPGSVPGLLLNFHPAAGARLVFTPTGAG